MSGSAYARLVPKIHRHRRLPKIDRPWRPRMIAWAGPAAFSHDRFYEIDKWYKARIDKPEKIPKFHIIDPANHTHSLAELMARESKTQGLVNIGYKLPEEAPVAKTEEEKAVLEKKARKMELVIDTDQVARTSSLAVYHHYNMFEDLFGKGVYFENAQTLEVAFGDHVVCTGNVIDVEQLKQAPEVSIGSVGQGYNTLLMVNLDGNAFKEGGGEFVQWIVSNIPDGQKITAGEEIAQYIQPLPFYGTGYHRVAFILFRHKEKISLEHIDGDVESRVMNVSQFYKKYENAITPSHLSFLQTSYGQCVKDKLHQIGLTSPIFEYEYNEALKPAQKEFPEKPQPFDLYMDMYRDPKEVEAELLEERLKRAQLDDLQAPKWLDPNYNENKRTLPAWQHRRMLSRDGRNQALYNNSLSQ